MKMTLVRSAVLGLAAVCTSGLAMGQAGMGGPRTQAMGTGTPAADKAFLSKSTQGGNDEIALSQAALKKSKNPEIQAYAQQMVTDHMKLASDVQPFIKSMDVKVPTKLLPADQASADRMSAMKGEKFDMEYVKAMVGGHHTELGLFMTERDTTTNMDLKPVVAAGTDVIMQHTQMIDAIAQKMGIQTPPMPAPSSGN